MVNQLHRDSAIWVKYRFSFFKFLQKYVGLKVKTKPAVFTDFLVTAYNSVKIFVG